MDVVKVYATHLGLHSQNNCFVDLIFKWGIWT